MRCAGPGAADQTPSRPALTAMASMTMPATSCHMFPKVRDHAAYVIAAPIITNGSGISRLAIRPPAGV